MIGSNPPMATIVLGMLLGAVLSGGLPEEGASPSSALVRSFSLSSRLPADAPPSGAVVLVETPLLPPRSRPRLMLPAPPVQPPRPRPWLAAAEVVGINFAVWAYVHYVSDMNYSYVSWETIRDNFRDSWEWDHSRYFINFYHHPYHGYLYFNAGRANGLGFWGSSLAALGGSLWWEMFMEKNRPSLNDLITTATGGCVYGEIGYRFSNRVRGKGGKGLDRVWREAVGALLDPVGAINRLFNGRKDGGPGAMGSSTEAIPLGGEITLAGPVIARSADFEGVRAVPLASFTLDYGDQAGTGWSGKPFDVFTVRGRLRWGPDRPHLSLSIAGALFGQAWAGRGGGSHFAGLYQYYEYYGIGTLRLGGPSFSAGLTSRFALSPKVRLTTAIRLGWLALGGADDFSTDPVGDRRRYNFGTGLTMVAEAGLRIGKHECASASWRHYGLHTFRLQVGTEVWDIFLGRVRVPIWKRFGLGAEFESCRRGFAFRDSEPGARRLYEARAFASLQF